MRWIASRSVTRELFVVKALRLPAKQDGQAGQVGQTTTQDPISTVFGSGVQTAVQTVETKVQTVVQTVEKTYAKSTDRQNREERVLLNTTPRQSLRSLDFG